ncbi:hypothetical protein ABZ839_10485 [Streptomyces cellulosae]
MSAPEHFIAAKLTKMRSRRTPYETVLRVFHGWCRANGYPLPDDDEFMDAIEAAGFPFVMGQRDDWLIVGAHLLPMGCENT